MILFFCLKILKFYSRALEEYFRCLNSQLKIFSQSKIAVLFFDSIIRLTFLRNLIISEFLVFATIIWGIFIFRMEGTSNQWKHIKALLFLLNRKLDFIQNYMKMMNLVLINHTLYKENKLKYKRKILQS